MVGLSSGTWSLARQCSDSSTGRKPQSASNVVSASEQLGLVERVLEGARRVVVRHPGGLLGGEPGLGLLVGGVRLQRQRLLGGEHLHQERQPGRRTARARLRPSRTSGSLLDRLVQRRAGGQHARARPGARPSTARRTAGRRGSAHPGARGSRCANPRGNAARVFIAATSARRLPGNPRSGAGTPSEASRPAPAKGGRTRRFTPPARTSGAPSRAASAVRSSGIRCDSRSAATRAV